MATNIKLDKALHYSIMGLQIFPVSPNNKQPMRNLARRGYLEATLSEQIIYDWWNRCPDANIGLSLAASNLVCIDVDSYKKDCAFNHYISDK